MTDPFTNPTTAVALAFGLLFAVGFLTPTWIAFARHLPQRWPLLIANILLGGTGIIWVLCLMWSIWPQPGPRAGTVRRSLRYGVHL